MANIKISELEELTTVADDDVLPIVDVSENETKKVNKSNIIDGLIKENTDALLTNVVSRNLLGINDYSYVIWSLNSGATITAGKENLKITTSGKAYSGIFGKLCQFANLDENKTYTVSFYAKASANIRLQYGLTSNSRQIDITSQTKRISIQETGKNLKNTNFQFYCLSTVVCTINIENIMIDEGNVATPYTPYLNLQEISKKYSGIAKAASGYTAEALDYIRVGNICQANIVISPNTDITASGSSSILIATGLPIPTKNTQFVAIAYDGSSKFTPLRLRINTDGNLYIWYSQVSLKSKQPIIASISYITN